MPEVPAELVESVRVAAVAPLVTTLPNWSWTWTAKGPTLAVALTVWLPDTVEVKASLLAAPATMVKPLGRRPRDGLSVDRGAGQSDRRGVDQGVGVVEVRRRRGAVGDGDRARPWCRPRSW